jgi:hypothetical protein
MQSNKPYPAGTLAVAIVGLGLAVPAAFAGSLTSATLDTGIAPWMVTRTLIGGETAYNEPGDEDSAGDSQLYTAVDVTAPLPPSWANPGTVGDESAKWISWAADTGITPDDYSGDNENSSIINDGTSYIYTDTFTLMGAANASIEVSDALVAADNIITGVSLKDVTVDKNVPLAFTDNSLTFPPAPDTNYYYTPSAFSTLPNSGLFQSSPSQTFTLTVDVVNWDGSKYDAPESTGLLLDGSAAAIVPLPAAGWAILMLMGGFATWRAGLKRFHVATAVS